MMNRSECLLNVLTQEVVERRLLVRGSRTRPSLRLQNEVWSFFYTNARLVDDLTPAALMRMLDLAMLHGDDWQQRARQTFRPHPRAMVVPPLRTIEPRHGVSLTRTRAQIVHGDFLERCGQHLDPESVDAVITSPPYAMQRSAQYGGITENDYPGWTSRWMAEVRRVLKLTGNVAIVIRPHLRQGTTASYTRYMIEYLQQDGWNYCDDLIWYKPDAPPVGNPGRPRRVWEAIHWFSRAKKPYCNPRAGGRASQRIGMPGWSGQGSNWHVKAS